MVLSRVASPHHPKRGADSHVAGEPIYDQQWPQLILPPKKPIYISPADQFVNSAPLYLLSLSGQHFPCGIALDRAHKMDFACEHSLQSPIFRCPPLRCRISGLPDLRTHYEGWQGVLDFCFDVFWPRKAGKEDEGVSWPNALPCLETPTISLM